MSDELSVTKIGYKNAARLKFLLAAADPENSRETLRGVWQMEGLDYAYAANGFQLHMTEKIETLPESDDSAIVTYDDEPNLSCGYVVHFSVPAKALPVESIENLVNGEPVFEIVLTKNVILDTLANWPHETMKLVFYGKEKAFEVVPCHEDKDAKTRAIVMPGRYE